MSVRDSRGAAQMLRGRYAQWGRMLESHQLGYAIRMKDGKWYGTGRGKGNGRRPNPAGQYLKECVERKKPGRGISPCRESRKVETVPRYLSECRVFGCGTQ